MTNSVQLAVTVPEVQAVETTAAPRTRTAPIKVVYIAGDGRSGSTLLDRLIGAYQGVFSCGELGNLLQSTGSFDEYCACSARAQECPFWNDVIMRWSASVPGFSPPEYRRLQHRFERLRFLFNPFNEVAFGRRRFARYAEYTYGLFDAIAELSGAEAIVDSSKSPARALALSRVPGLDLRLLHLVRDVRGVAYSLRIPYRERPKDGPFANVRRRSNLRFAGTWALVNYFCERVRAQIRGPSLFIRYEDYTADPDSILAGVAGLMGMPRIGYDMGAGQLLKQGHQVAGNEVRMKPIQKISTDEHWRTYFGSVMQKWLYLVVLPLMLRYRYRL